MGSIFNLQASCSTDRARGINAGGWTVPKYRSNSVYTSSYKRHRTVQYESRRESGVSKQTSVRQLATRHSREYTLSAVGPDVPVE